MASRTVNAVTKMAWLSAVVLGMGLPAAVQAAPTEKTHACTEFRKVDGSRDDSAVTKDLAGALSYVPGPIFGGETYCTVDHLSGGMFSLGKAYAVFHERGEIEGIPYRIDYRRSWAEVYLGERAGPMLNAGEETPPHFLCRYAIAKGEYSDLTHSAASPVECAQFPRNDYGLISWFSDSQNGVYAQSHIADGPAYTPEYVQMPILATERSDGQAGNDDDIYLAIPGVEGQLRVARGDKNKAWFTSGLQYQLAFNPLGPMGLARRQNEPRKLFISEDVGRFIGKMAGKDHFLVGGKYRNRVHFELVPIERLSQSLEFLAPIAGRMMEDAG